MKTLKFVGPFLFALIFLISASEARDSATAKLAFIRHRLNGNQYLNIYVVPTAVGGEITPLIASDTWIGNMGADSEITHMTRGDMDGDGTDELIFIRHRLNENQYLNIYDIPTAVGGDINPLIASDTWIGNVGTSNEITHMAAGDVDGDGTDELLFIRHRLNGNQYLNIYDIPTAVGGDINPLLASDTWIGNVGTNNEITHMASGDMDGDGTDELIFIRHRLNDNQYLHIYDIPTAVGSDINPLLASDLWIGNIGANNEITHMASGDSDGDGPDEILFIRQRANGNQYLNIYDIPTAVGGDINPLIASDTWIGNVGTGNEITHFDVLGTAPDIDLSVSEILMSQGVDMGLSPKEDLGAVTVPRIAGRDTVVRAFVEVTGEGGPVSSVSARLHGDLSGAPLAGSPLSATLSSVVSPPSTDNWAHSLNFVLPETWIVSGASFYLDLDPDDEYAESDEENNRVPASGTTDFEFQDTPDFDIMIVPVIHDGLTPDPAANAEIEDWVRWLYPAPNVNIEIHETVTYTGAPVSPSGANWNSVLNFVTDIRNAETSRPDLYYYGVFDPGYTYGVVGTAWVPYSPSSPYPIGVGTDHSPFAGTTSAHEMGHNHGRSHAAGCGSLSGIDPSYPYPDAQIGVVGWQIGSTTLYNEVTYADVMSYCESRWISDYNYRAFYDWDDALTRLDYRSLRVPVNSVFYLSGGIQDSRVVSLRAYDLPDHAETPNEGDHRLVLLDAQGRAVAIRRFNTVPADHLPGWSGFSVKVDRGDLDIGGYRILDPHGRCLSEEWRVGPPPTIEILHAERSRRGTATIEWWEDSLYDLMRVVMVATAPEYRWEVRSMGESRYASGWAELNVDPGPAWVRVIISDGVRSAMAQSAF